MHKSETPIEIYWQLIVFLWCRTVCINTVEQIRESGRNLDLNDYSWAGRPVNSLCSSRFEQAKNQQTYLRRFTNFSESYSGRVKHWFS